MKKMIILGQSTAYGLDIVKPSTVDMSKDDYRNQSCFWHYVFKKINFDEYENLAAPGDSNESIFRKILTYYAENQNNDDELFFLVCLSAGELFEVYDKTSDSLKNVIFLESSTIVKAMNEKSESLFTKRTPQDIKDLMKLYSEKFLHVDHSLQRFFASVIAIQGFFKEHNLNYRFIHSCSPALSMDWDTIKNHPISKMYDPLIDKSRFIDYMEVDSLNETVNNSAKLGRFFHALEDGHAHYGKYLATKF